MRNRVFATVVATILVILVSGAHANIGAMAPGGLGPHLNADEPRAGA